MYFQKVINDFLIYGFVLFIFLAFYSIAVAQLVLGITLILFIILFIAKKKSPLLSELRWLYYTAAAYLIWSILAAVMNPGPAKSLYALREEWLFLIIPIGVYLFRKTKTRSLVLSTIAIAMIPVTLYSVAQYFLGINWFSSNPLYPAPAFGYRISGFLSHMLTFGNMMALVSIFFMTLVLTGNEWMNKQQRWLYSFTALASTLLALLTFSRAPLVAIIVSIGLLFLYLGRKYWKQTVAFVSVLLILLFLIPGISNRFVKEFDKEYSGTYEGGRMFIWKNSAKLITDHPIFGVGRENFKTVYATYLRKDIPESRKVASAHNDLINAAANNGIPGSLFLLLLYIIAGLYFIKGLKANSSGIDNRQLQAYSCTLAAFAATLGCFIISMFHSTFSDDMVRHLLMFIWAVGLWPLYPSQNLGTQPLVKGKTS